MLMKYGANVNLADGCNATPFFWAACTDNLEILKYIYKHYNKTVNINHVDDSTATPLIIAAKKNYNRSVTWLLNLPKVKPNIQTKEGVTALGKAAYWGNLDMVKKLVLNGANVNFVNIKGQTILDFALERLKDDDWPTKNKIEFEKVVKYLKAHGAKSSKNHTPTKDSN